MQPQDYKLISAYLDDELDDAARSAVEQRLVDDSEFAAAFADFGNQDAQLKTAYSAIDNKPVPDELATLLSGKTENQNTTKADNVIQPPVTIWKKWLPLAASVALAVIILPFVFDQNRSDEMSIAVILNSQLSGETLNIDEQKIYLSMSFDNANGQWCREYFIASGNAEKQRIACQTGDSWQTILEVVAPFPDDGVYAPASGGSAEIDAWLDANMASDSLSKAQEQDRIGG